MQITDEKEYIEKLTKLLIHVASELASLLVIPRNESLIKVCSSDDVRKMLQKQTDSAFDSFLKHVPFYEKSLDEVLTFDIASLNDFDFLEKNRNLLTTSIKDIKNLYDENLLHLKRNERNQELQRVMEFLEKIITRLAEIVGKVVERSTERDKK